MKKGNTKTIPLQPIKTKVHFDFIEGLVLKRDVTVREARHILKKLLGININNREDHEYAWEYREYNEGLTQDVNKWLKGEIGDEAIQDYAYDCSDESLGFWNCLNVCQYLQKKGII